MKKILLLVLLTSVFYASHAQRQRRYVSSAGSSGLSLGVEAALPVGEYGKVYSFIAGGSLQYEAKPASDLGITFSVGYLHYPFKAIYGGGSVGFVPLLAGVKYYLSPTVFFHGQLGAAVGTATGQGTSFAYSPGIGLKFSPQVDAELKYMGISNKGGTLENVGVRFAYNF